MCGVYRITNGSSTSTFFKDNPCVGVNCGEGGCILRNGKPMCVCIGQRMGFVHDDPATWKEPDEHGYCNPDLGDGITPNWVHGK